MRSCTRNKLASRLIERYISALLVIFNQYSRAVSVFISIIEFGIRDEAELLITAQKLRLRDDLDAIVRGLLSLEGRCLRLQFLLNS